MDELILAGRILFSFMFVASALMAHFAARAQTVPYAASRGVPMAAFWVPATGVQILTGGLMIALGVYPDLGALLVAAFMLSAAFTIHGFWKDADPQEQQNQMAHFMKNLVMTGGALIIFAVFAYGGEAIGYTITEPLFDLR